MRSRTVELSMTYYEEVEEGFFFRIPYTWYGSDNMDLIIWHYLTNNDRNPTDTE